MQNDTGTRNDSWHKTDTASSLEVRSSVTKKADTVSPQHKRAARALYDAFTGGEFASLPDQLRASLTSVELELLAEAVALAINPGRAGLPTDTAWRSIRDAACRDYHSARRRQGAA